MRFHSNEASALHIVQYQGVSIALSRRHALSAKMVWSGLVIGLFDGGKEGRGGKGGRTVGIVYASILHLRRRHHYAETITISTCDVTTHTHWVYVT